MSTVFDVLSRFRLCKGFPVVAKRTAKDARGNTVGTTEEWRSRDDITVALVKANAFASEGKSGRPETITTVTRYVSHDLSG